jgi:hypothetical protein
METPRRTRYRAGMSRTASQFGPLLREWRQRRHISQLGMAIGLAWLRLTVGWIGVAGSPLLLVPALALEGARRGLVMAPLAATVLAGLPARDAGAAAGVLVTMQQVALIGLVFFGVLGHARSGAGYATALGTSLDWLTGLALVLAALVGVLLGRNLPAVGAAILFGTPNAARRGEAGLELCLTRRCRPECPSGRFLSLLNCLCVPV